MKKLRQWLGECGPFVAVFLIWGGLILFEQINPLSWSAAWQIPEAAGYWFLLSWAFDQWLWRLPCFKWLSAVPYIDGTWEGTLQTTWSNPKTGEVPAAKRIVLVVRQYFSSISCVMYSDESYSSSYAERLVSEDDGRVILTYGYHNVPSAHLRHRSPANEGVATFNVGVLPAKVLRGNYFTDRNSTGHMDLRFVSSEHVDSFPETPLL